MGENVEIKADRCPFFGYSAVCSLGHGQANVSPWTCELTFIPTALEAHLPSKDTFENETPLTVVPSPESGLM
jgi:hypothetical protein